MKVDLPDNMQMPAASPEIFQQLGTLTRQLHDTLNMLGLRYDSEAGRQMAARIAQSLRDAAYASSLALAREKGPYPLFSADACLAEPMDMRQCIRLNLDCADICLANSRVATRRTGHDVSLIRTMLKACIGACQRCGAECGRHETRHRQRCAQMCNACVEDCLYALSSLDPSGPA